jgi:hypothetical protein
MAVEEGAQAEEEQLADQAEEGAVLASLGRVQTVLQLQIHQPAQAVAVVADQAVLVAQPRPMELLPHPAVYMEVVVDQELQVLPTRAVVLAAWVAFVLCGPEILDPSHQHVPVPLNC